MPYTTPRTWVAGDVLTAAQLNTDVRDNVASLANPPACRVYRATLQTIATATDTAISFSTAGWATTPAMWVIGAPTRITFATAGLYVVGGNLAYTPNGTGVRVLTLRLNGTSAISSLILAPSSAGVDTALTVETTWKFAAADYLELIAHQTSGGNLDTRVALSNSQQFWATRVGIG